MDIVDELNNQFIGLMKDGVIKVSDPTKGRQFMTKETVAFKTSNKKQQLLETLTLIYQTGGISQDEFNAKRAIINNSIHVIKELIEAGQEESIEEKLGLLQSEKLQIKNQSEFIKSEPQEIQNEYKKRNRSLVESWKQARKEYERRVKQQEDQAKIQKQQAEQEQLRKEKEDELKKLAQTRHRVQRKLEDIRHERKERIQELKEGNDRLIEVKLQSKKATHRKMLQEYR